MVACGIAVGFCGNSIVPNQCEYGVDGCDAQKPEVIGMNFEVNFLVFDFLRFLVETQFTNSQFFFTYRCLSNHT